MKVAGLVAKEAVVDGPKIELSAESVEHSAVVNSWGGKHGFVDLECMSLFGGLHGQINGRVKLDGLLVDLDRLEGPGDKYVVQLEQARALVRHDMMSTRLGIIGQTNKLHQDKDLAMARVEKQVSKQQKREPRGVCFSSLTPQKHGLRGGCYLRDF
jgi:hypothetical protein